jgi:predicted SprT family Zn-dependent metalloprotease
MEAAMRDDEIGAYAPNRRPWPTRTYDSLDGAYASFNTEFFDGKLPPCLITLQRLRTAYGYFSGARFVNINADDEVVDEIALNPVHFAKETPERVLATLAHEMVHLWQFHFGKPGRGRYHNREWARMMNAIGLGPSDTGKPGGKPTGEKVGHYIREGGPFAKACATYLKANAALLYQDRAYCAKEDNERAARERERKAASKTRYLCPACGLHAWAKPGVHLRHVDCDEEMELRRA